MTGELATFARDGDGERVHLRRHFPHPLERVWAALTDPEQIKVWLMDLDILELEVGGAIRFEADCMGPTGEILVLDPPSVFEYTWTGHDPPLSIVRFELESTENGTMLDVSHIRLPTRSSAVEHAAGWHTHIEWMQAMLSGGEKSDFDSRHGELVALYTTTIEGVSDV